MKAKGRIYERKIRSNILLKNFIALNIIIGFFLIPKGNAFILQNPSFLKDSLSLSVSASASVSRSQDNQKINMDELAQIMKERASKEEAFTKEELDGILLSFQSLLSSKTSTIIDMEKLKSLLQKSAHLSHKQWDRTGEAASKLQDILLPEKEFHNDFESIMERVLKDGNWYGAYDASKQSKDKPWAVLVTGVNGIRKTTSIYQPWFDSLLKEALVSPSDKQLSSSTPPSVLPIGSNSFFRQLDHMICIIANVEFANLYSMTKEKHELTNDSDPCTQTIHSYANLKDAIFTRYRTLAEMLGILLLREASQRNMNVMAETSGRDVAMFEYINNFFPSDKYNKLVLHFTINDLEYAEQSVDRRMTEEIYEGFDAVQNMDQNDRDCVQQIVNANQGGPYGSDVLKGVQSASDKVWLEKVLCENGVADTWYKAEIAIEASHTEDWKAYAIVRDGNNQIKKGKEYTFKR